MNHVYRLVWSPAQGIWRVTSELTRRHAASGGARRRAGSPALMLALSLLAAPALAEESRGGSGGFSFGGAGGAGGQTQGAPGQTSPDSSKPAGAGGGAADGDGGTYTLALGGPFSGAGGLAGSPGATGGTGGYNGGGGGGGGSACQNGICPAAAGGPLIGGNGGNGGDANGGGGGGGAGGYAQVWTMPASGLALNSVDLQGGNGGNGGGVTGRSSQVQGGGGGDGGGGLLIRGGGDLLLGNGRILRGGTGGNGGGVLPDGSSTPSSAWLGDGGRGGTGIQASSGSLLQITNQGTILGGNGGLGGVDGARNGTAGAGGIGIDGSNLGIDNYGLIMGGYTGGHAGDAAYQAAAVRFAGGSNALTLRAGASLDGALSVDAGSAQVSLAPGSTLAGNVLNHGGQLTLTLDRNATLNGDVLATGGTTLLQLTGSAGATSSALSGLTGLQLASTGNRWALNGVLSDLAGAGLQADIANNSTLTVNGVTTLNTSLTKNGGGTLELGGPLAAPTATAMVNGGTLSLLGQSGALGFGGGIVNNGALLLSSTNDTSLAGVVSGSGRLLKDGSGTLTLLGGNVAGSSTIVREGTLAGDAALLHGSYSVGGSSAASLIFRQNGDATFDGHVGGLGNATVTKAGSGTLTLASAATISNAGFVLEAGTLIVNSSISVPAMNVGANTALGGNGMIGAPVHIGNQGTLLGQSGQTLTMASLTMDAGASLNVSLGAPSSQALFYVEYDIALNGTLNVRDAGGYGAGVYRLFEYSGSVVDNGLQFGTLPAGVDRNGLSLQTSVPNLVNLVYNGQVPLTFWRNGSGTWNAVSTNWTDQSGGIAGSNAQGGLAIFQGTAGTVTVDNSGGQIAFSGMQFASDGYRIDGGALRMDGAGSVIRVGDGSAAGSQYHAVIASAITGTGSLVKDDLGVLDLAGSNSYTGGTTVRAGTLKINGSLAGSLSVGSGARLQGRGSAGPVTINGGATIAPGNSIGTLTFNGSYTQLPGSIYEVEVDAAGNSDRIVVNGSADLQGGTVNVLKAAGDYRIGTRYTILDASGGISGSFAGLTQNLPFIGLALAQDAQHVYLDVTRTATSFAELARTRNQNVAAGAIEALGAGQTAYDAVAAVTSAEAARSAYDALSGELYASVRGVLLDDSRQWREAALLRARTAAGPVDRPAGWARAYGTTRRHDGDGNAATLSSDGGGVLFGADAALGAGHVGVGGGYGQSRLDIDGRNSSADVDSYQLGMYAGLQQERLGLRAGVAYGWHGIDSRRQISIAQFHDRARADYHARSLQAFGEAGYALDSGMARIEPFAGLAYVRLDSDAMREQGGAAALSVETARDEVWFSSLGVRLDSTLGRDDVRARGQLGWLHADGDLRPVGAMAFAGGGNFAPAGLPVARDVLQVELGADITLNRSASLGLYYAGQFAGQVSDHSLRAEAVWRF